VVAINVDNESAPPPSVIGGCHPVGQRKKKIAYLDEHDADSGQAVAKNRSPYRKPLSGGCFVLRFHATPLAA
jgi:hypothetical protein